MGIHLLDISGKKAGINERGRGSGFEMIVPRKIEVMRWDRGFDADLPGADNSAQNSVHKHTKSSRKYDRYKERGYIIKHLYFFSSVLFRHCLHPFPSLQFVPAHSRYLRLVGQQSPTLRH